MDPSQYADPMKSSLITWAASGGESAGEHGQELPMSPLGYGLVALSFFVLCLVVLWSFRNTAAKSSEHGADQKSHH